MDTSIPDSGGRGDVAANTLLVPQMALQELRGKVAELCGWKRNDGNASWPETYWVRPQDKAMVTINELPDYPNDLNACHELIDLLVDKGWTCELANGLDKTWECTFETGTSGHKDFRQRYEAADALAVAICRAFVAVMENRHRSENGPKSASASGSTEIRSDLSSFRAGEIAR